MQYAGYRLPRTTPSRTFVNKPEYPPVLAEVEGDTPEAFQKRRELVQLLVEKITADRDEDGRARVNMTYRFGPPPEDPFVSSVGNSTVFLTHHIL